MTNYLRAFYYLRSMLKNAYQRRDEIIRYQSKKLRGIIRYSYENVPFYHKEFRRLGIRPEEIATISDLDRLPILTKDKMRKSFGEMLSREFNHGDLKMLSTSGSTGQPLSLYISGAEEEFRKAKHLRANIACGQKFRDHWVVVTSPHHFGANARLQRLMRIYLPMSVSVFTSIAGQASMVAGMRPDVLDGYSSSLFLLAREVERRSLKKIRPRFVIGGAELVDEVSRRFIEKVFDAPFYDQYACVELDRISWQCPEKVGYHIDADSTIVEFVDEYGVDVSSGEKGKVVCTSLFNKAMPLLRYEVGDIGIGTDDTCPCGRTLPLMKVVEGRKDSLVLLSDGRVLSPRTFTVAIRSFKHYNRIDLFRIVQKRTDYVEINIKMKEDNIDRDLFKNALVSHLGNTIGLGSDMLSFHINFVQDIPLDKTGKFMIVVSELSKK